MADRTASTNSRRFLLDRPIGRGGALGVGLLLLATSIWGILQSRPESGGPFPDDVLLFGASVYLLGPLGAALIAIGAAATRRSLTAWILGTAAYAIAVALLLVLAVNVGAVSP